MPRCPFHHTNLFDFLFVQVKAERGGGVYEVPKNEIAVALAASKEVELADNSEWLLNTACTSFLLLVTLHFLLHLESELTIASKTLQKHNLAPSDVIFCIELLYEYIEMLYVTNGVALQGYLDM